jgi:uncharacterized protein (DUF697 family)
MAAMAEQAEQSTSQSSPAGEATSERNERAAELVDRFAIWSGCAGLIPLPLVDVAAIGVLQLQMLRRLSQIYGVPFHENRGKALLAGLAGTAVPLTSTVGVTSMLKGIPLIGTVVSIVAMPALAGAATFAIGRAFIQHFISGGTLLDFNPPDYREFIKSQRDMWRGRPHAGASDGPSDAPKDAAASS